MNPEQRSSVVEKGTQVVEKVATRMRFPHLFGLVAALFVIDLVVPDVIPFIDEIMLALMTALIAMWREKVVTQPPSVTVVPPDTRQLPPSAPQ